MLPNVGALFDAGPKGDAEAGATAAPPKVDPEPPPKVDDPKAGLPPNPGDCGAAADPKAGAPPKLGEAPNAGGDPNPPVGLAEAALFGDAAVGVPNPNPLEATEELSVENEPNPVEGLEVAAAG